MGDYELTEREQRIVDWTKKKRKRKKVTPDDVGRGFGKFKSKLPWHKDDNEPRQPLTWRDYVRRGVIVVSLVGIVGAGIVYTNEVRGFNEADTLNQAKISELSTELAKLQTDAKEVKPVTPKQVLSHVDEASALAQDVAKLQNQYIGIEITTETVNGNVVVKGAEEVKQINAGLRDKFSKAARTGGFDPAQEWYHMTVKDQHGNAVVAPKGSYAWVAQPVLDPGNGAQVPVVWLAKDTKTQELLAWTTANYLTNEKKFDQVKVSLTVQGEERLGASISGPDGTTTQVG